LQRGRNRRAASDTDSPKYALEFVEHVNEGTPPDAGWQAGFESTVTVVKANEAVLNNLGSTLRRSWFVV
jgi:hypothetical protein